MDITTMRQERFAELAKLNKHKQEFISELADIQSKIDCEFCNTKDDDYHCDDCHEDCRCFEFEG